MTKPAFNIAAEALTSIAFFRDYYTSPKHYNQRHKEVVSILRNRSSSSDNPRDQQLLVDIADALERRNAN